ncbi:hypothetical protein CMO92_01970 [Candidatus Woesearchaeota archaeon]|nr:hypothetical protein [Candidatus Woesearchaeota archaeon]
MKPYLLLILLLLPFVLAEEDQLNKLESLSLKHTISNTINIEPESSDFKVSTLEANLTWFPRISYRQGRKSFTTTPQAEVTDIIHFSWESPSLKNTLKVETILENTNDFVRVKKKVPFPIRNLDPEFSKYIQPQEIIDITPEIRSQASEIAEGKDDLYEIVFELAKWAQDNIEYNLSTVTAEASQKSSWVIQNKIGVCDELTSLFISMARSLGIPARFISGISHTNLELFKNKWGPHGWAEVYFPNIGWIPFDPTYGQYGFIDATHVKLKESLDAKEPSIRYTTKGRNIKLEADSLDFDTIVLSQGRISPSVTDLSLNPLEKEVGFGSYNLITVEVENRKDYYVPVSLQLSKTSELEFFEDLNKVILLRPKQKKSVSWKLNVPNKLEEGYVYTFPLEIHDSRGGIAKTSFTSQKSFTVFGESYVDQIMLTQKTDDFPLNDDVSLDCALIDDKLYANQETTLTCTLLNNGKEQLKNIDFCITEECETLNLKPNEPYEKTVTIKESEEGVKTLLSTATRNDLSKSDYVVLSVLDQPQLTIQDIIAPETLNFRGQKEIAFTLSKISQSNPQNVRILLDHKNIQKDYYFPEFDRDNTFRIMLKGDVLHLKQNQFTITAKWTDLNNKQFSTEKTFIIALEKPTIGQRILIHLNQLASKIDGWI